MKPIKLIMSAFGPYAGKETVDFTHLGDNGVYLITGDTGSGKTTIFDAISYALYGKTSAQQGNDARDAKSLRSDYAPLNRETYVELTFDHQGSIYRIKRNPEYLRKARRGGGTTKQAAHVILYKDEEEPVEKSKQVDPIIQNEILHIDHNQFKQIAMIAQGEFRDLLTADKATRTAILQNVFMTRPYAQMEELLKVKQAKAKADFEYYERSLLQYVKNLDIDETSPNNEQLRSYQQADTVLEIDAMIEVMRTLTEHNKDQLEQWEKEVDEQEQRNQSLRKDIVLAQENNAKMDQVFKLQDQKAQLTRRAEDMEQQEAVYKRQETASTMIQPLYRTYRKALKDQTRMEEQIQGCSREIAAAKQQYTEDQTALQISREQEPNIKAKRDQALRMKDKEETYRQKAELIRALNTLANRIKQLEMRQKDNEEAILSLSDQEETMEKRIADNEDVSVRLEQNRAQKKQWQTCKEDIDVLLTRRLQQLQTRQEALIQAQKQVQAKEQAYQIKKGTYEQASHTFRLNQAGILAGELEEGKPCPVCGSVHHPNKAVMVDIKYTEAFID